jgi:Zn-dependent protease with chaperone function
MSNPFYYLAGLILATAYPLGCEPLTFVERSVTPWMLLGSFVVYGGLCWAVLARPIRQVGLARFVLSLLALAMYAQLLFIFHLPLWVWQFGVEDEPLAGTLLTLLPLMGLFGIQAIVNARTDPENTSLRFAFQSFLGLSFLPILLILLLDEVFQRIHAMNRLAFVYPAAGWVLGLGGMTLILVFLPPLLRLILLARPLEKGPLRDRLERICDQAGFRAAEFLVVRTGSSRMANAFVAGLSARWRYVFFTRAILTGMKPEELECVLLHEVTHAQKRHIQFYLVGALAFSLVTGLAYEALESLDLPSLVIPGAMLSLMVTYWILGFGFVSRRFETEADLVAARLAPPNDGGIPPYAAARRMAAALDRVAWLNRIPIRAPAWLSWRHFTIEKRIEILLRAEQDSSVGTAFERFCTRLRWGAVAFLIGGLLCGAVLLVIQHRRAPETDALFRAHEAVDRGRKALEEKKFEQAREDLRRGIEGGSDSAVAYVWLADAERALGRTEEAKASEETARKKGVLDARLRLRLR